MTEKESGIVTGINENSGKYGFALGTGNWFNGYGKCPCKKGDIVEVDFERNDKYKNVKKCVITSRLATSPKLPGKQEFHLTLEEQRARALEASLKFHGEKVTLAEIMSSVGIFYKYINTGDMGFIKPAVNPDKPINTEEFPDY